MDSRIKVQPGLADFLAAVLAETELADSEPQRRSGPWKLIFVVIVLTLINLPIIVWMLYTYFKEIPGEILEAARMDGA